MFRFLRWSMIFGAALFLASCFVDSPSSPSMSSPLISASLSSKYGYPADYKVKSIKKQVSILRQHFPELKGASVAFATRAIPNLGGLPIEDLDVIWLPIGFGNRDAEGLFAIPQWELLAPTYGKAVERVFAELAKQRPLRNLLDGRLGLEYLRETEYSQIMWKRLAEEQNNHAILIVPAQFGMRHRGKSVKQVNAAFTENEFGLGAYAIGIMLLTHPERLQSTNDLWIGGAGDEYLSGNSVPLSPLFGFFDGGVEFRARWVDGANECCGLASGFLNSVVYREK